jgi:hypothetical protein
MQDTRFNVGDKVVVNDKHAFLCGYSSVIVGTLNRFFCIVIDNYPTYFKGDELDMAP